MARGEEAEEDARTRGVEPRMLTTTLFLSTTGDDPAGVVRALAKLGLLPTSPDRVEVDYETQEPTTDWLDRWFGKTKRSLKAMTDDAHTLVYEPSGLVTLRVPNFELDPRRTFGELSTVPFAVAAIGQVHVEWWDEDYSTVSFGRGHTAHAFACAFRGAGYDRLVSRRWLDAGPWRRHTIGECDWIQFHDFGASPAKALEQAQPGWQRMGLSDEGGYLQDPFVYQDDVGGIYDPTERKLKVIVPGTHDVSQRKMLEIAAARRDLLIRKEMPIDRTAFIFIDEDNARRHLHELWLREHECWFVGPDPVQRRLDETYAPPPVEPPW